MNWIKHFLWFIKESKHFLGYSYTKVLTDGGLIKGIKHANFMVKYDKLSKEEKWNWYINADRTI